MFLQHVTTNTKDAFAGVEMMIQETLFPRLFFGNTNSLLSIVGALGTMPVKKAVLILLNTVSSVNDKYLSVQRTITELIWYVTGGGTFSRADHLMALREESRDG